MSEIYAKVVEGHASIMQAEEHGGHICMPVDQYLYVRLLAQVIAEAVNHGYIVYTLPGDGENVFAYICLVKEEYYASKLFIPRPLLQTR